MPENIENTNKTQNTENTNKKRKTIKMIAALILTFTALIVVFTLPNFSNNSKPEPTPPTEQPIEYPQANYEILEGIAGADVPDNFSDNEVFITSTEELTQYLIEYPEIKLTDATSKVVTTLGYTQILEKFNQQFFELHNIAIKAHVVLSGHTEYCVQNVLQNEDSAIVKVNNYLYDWGDVDAMPSPELEFMFIVLDKEITAAEYDIEEIKATIPVAEEHAVHVAKPVIYLYPENEMNINVKLDENKLTCIYPKYNNGWNVLAKPNGDLLDLNTGRSQYCLYYESVGNYQITNEGFIIKGENAAAFLEEKLAILGLNEREANEFIIYWLPILEANEYNYIRFATAEEIEANMSLNITPAPDSVIRVVMVFKGLDAPIDVNEQVLTTPERVGFTVVEWGGTILQ